MILAPTAAVESRRRLKTHRLATCWKIVRTDGATLRFTDHNAKLSVSLAGPDSPTTAEVFTPVGGIRASARGAGADGDANFQAIGAISSASITEEDLRAGRYRNARVTEYLVDWLYPWVGPLATSVYFIAETSYTREEWRASLLGLSHRLRHPTGDVYTKTCRADLGDDDCKFNLATQTVSGKTVSSVVDARRVFRTSSASLNATAGWYAQGTLTWTTGANAGLKSEVKVYSGSPNYQIELQQRMPFPIAVNDQFTITAGCDKSFPTCKAKFANGLNFQGEPKMPGNDALLATPRS